MGTHGRAAAGPGYAEHLTPGDWTLLARAGGLSGRDTADAVAWLRARPSDTERLLASEPVARAVLGTGEPDEPDPLLRASPFLVFAVAVHRGVAELASATYVREWAGPRQRIPVLGADDLRSFLDDAQRRLFLVELLASYTHVASGSTWTRTRHGWRRQRFSELDLVRLASRLDVVPEVEHAGVYRRLGDLCLFLTGVFPDHTAARGFRPLDVQRLGRAAAAPGGGAGLVEAMETRGGVGLLEQLGARWYHLATQATAGPLTGTMQVVGAVADRFGEARRVLNHLTDRYLFPVRPDWFPSAGS
ncbi:MAG: hypothetical protein KY434_09325 [Actinobacteria bacterium]|nr:hypothetical protein [Actinomycetota bacterium]